MENILTGVRGPRVPLRVEEVHDCENELVQIHLHNLGEKNAPTNRNNRKTAIQTTAQLMVHTLTGVRGCPVPLPVEEEHNYENGPVQIQLHNMEVNHALDQQMK